MCVYINSESIMNWTNIKNWFVRNEAFYLLTAWQRKKLCEEKEKFMEEIFLCY